jgi:hypothetical protein
MSHVAVRANIQPGPNDPPGQLYNLAEDIGESTNLFAQHPTIVSRLKVELKTIAGGCLSKWTQRSLNSEVTMGTHSYFTRGGEIGSPHSSWHRSQESTS